jgi:hypothetical protein
VNVGGYRNTNRKVALAAFAAISLGLCGICVLDFAYGPTLFDRKIWLESGERAVSGDSPRLRMADGLVDSGRLIGMTPDQVAATPGPQIETSYFRPEYAYVYRLGDERGLFSIDSEWLVLKADPDGTVTEARIVTD